MTESQPLEIGEKRISRFFLLCILSCIVVNGVFLIVSTDQYVNEKHVSIAVIIMLLFGLYLNLFKNKKNGFILIIIAIILNVLTVLLATNISKDFCALNFILNVFTYTICIADFSNFFCYQTDKVRNYFVNLLLMALFVLLYVGSLVIIYGYIGIIQSV